LLLLAGRDNFAAAALLPLYYVADATVTLLRRLINREPLWQAHRDHFYQRAVDSGFSVRQIVSRVFAVNLVLAAFAAATIFNRSSTIQFMMLAAGSAVVAALLWRFNRVCRRR